MIFLKMKKCSAACLGRCGMGQGGSPKPLSGATLASHTDCAASHNVHSAVEKSTGAQWRNPMPLTLIVHSGASHRCTVEKGNEHLSQCAQWRKATNASHTKKKLLPNSAINGQCSKTALYSIYHMEPIFHWFCANSRVLSYQPVKYTQSINCK